MKEQIKQLHETVVPWLKLAGAKEKALVLNLEDVDEAELASAHVWLEMFYGMSVKPVMIAQMLRTPEQWQIYKNLGITGLWEQEELNNALRSLRDHWMHRPSLFRRKQNAKQDSNEATVGDGPARPSGRSLRTGRKPAKGGRTNDTKSTPDGGGHQEPQ